MRQVRCNATNKDTLCNFKHLGVVKVAQIGLAKPEVFKKKLLKKSMIDETLKTPNK